jgi:SAM-dependent methyltransferase
LSPSREAPAARSAPPDAFGRAAREYELGRPDWPVELLDRVIANLNLGPGATVLDLGAGTGKLTRPLVSRFSRVIAVEPDDSMRSLLEQLLPDVEAVAATAESIPVLAGSIDCVFSAEAFHWFAAPAVLDELARVLRPGGGLVLLWNMPTREVEPVVPAEADRLIEEAIERGGQPGGPRVSAGLWREPFADSPFEELRHDQQERELLLSRDELIAYVLSISSIAAQPDEQRRELAARLQELVPAREYRRFVRTDAFWTRLA